MRVSDSAELMNVNSLKKLLKLYSHTLSSSTSSSSHIVRDRLQYICLTVLQQRNKSQISSDLMKLLESARLNTELFLKIDGMNAVDNGNTDYIKEKIISPEQQYEKLLPELWLKKELLASFANKGDVQSLLSSLDSLNNLLYPKDNHRQLEQYKDSQKTLAQIDQFKKQHLIFLRDAINKFLNNCTDINLAFVMMDKCLRSEIGQKVVHFGYFLRMVDIGIKHPTSTSHWFQIKNLLQQFLNIPYRSIWQIEIYEQLMKYCLVHQDIVGLTDALQMFFDWYPEKSNFEQRLSSELFEQIMEFIANKSSDAALHLFERISKYSDKPTFQCFYWCLKACADHGDEIGVETVRDLMIANGIDQSQWNTQIYNAIIGCNSFKSFDDRKIEDSLRLFKELLANDLQPDTDTFNALLSHHKNTNNDSIIDVDFMLHQMEQMKLFKVEPSQDTFSIILEFCCKHKHKEIAVTILSMIESLPMDQRLVVIQNKSVWLHYMQCFDTYQEISSQIDEIFQCYHKQKIGAQFLTNNMVEHITNICCSDICDQASLFGGVVKSCRNIQSLIEQMIENYDESQSISLEMNGYCKVFDVIYKMSKEQITERNIESGMYNLTQIDELFWRFMDIMKDLNIFFPDPDLLKPWLYSKDVELECLEQSSSLSALERDKYESIVDGIFEFIEYGVFVSPELIYDLCDNLDIDKNRSDDILQAYNERRKYAQKQRRKQPLPNFFC